MVKQIFSTKWKASKQPRKQRKYAYNAPLHIRRRFLAATLSKELRKKYSMRNIEVRKGDEVKIMRGKYKKKQGKINLVNLRDLKIAIEGIQITKKDGTKVNAMFHPSNVKIIVLNTDDQRRLKRINKEEKKEEKTTKEEKPVEKKSAEKKVKAKSENKSGEKKNVQEKK